MRKVPDEDYLGGFAGLHKTITQLKQHNEALESTIATLHVLLAEVVPKCGESGCQEIATRWYHTDKRTDYWCAFHDRGTHDFDLGIRIKSELEKKP
jgi:hypothetical protein